ncbi:MAG: alcohol dehydrogenase catalytic domain-containing protein [Pseudomonadota bacterium]
MKALVYTGTQEMAFREEPEPRAGQGESIVEVSASGICGSDMHAYLGHDERRVPPLILGHEAVGTVVEGKLRGRRVAINPLITCGECNACLGGRSNICAQRDIIGMYRAGAFANYVSIPDRNLVEVPVDMDDAHAALMEPCGTALHSVLLGARAIPRPLSEVRSLVIGAGAIGLLAALVLRDQGAKSLHLAETNGLRIQTAQNAGFSDVFNPLEELPDEHQFDFVIDAVGGAKTRAMGVQMVRPGGTIVHVGLQDNDAGLDTRYMTLQEVTFIGSYTYTMEDLRVALQKLHSGEYGSLEWIEQRPLSIGGQAFADLHDGRCASPKIVLRP